MSEYHEPESELSASDRDLHRALVSFKEEIEAVDWYHPRVSLCSDPSLKAVLAHNRDEEIEHACMTLEWLRRNFAKWDKHLKTYLFTEHEIMGMEESSSAAPSAGGSPDSNDGSLNIGSLKRQV